MKKSRGLITILLSLAVILLLTSCGGAGSAAGSTTSESGSEGTAAPAAAGSEKMISFGTSTIGDNFYVIGAGISSTLTPIMSEYSFTAEVTAGSNANCTMLQSGEVEFATVTNSSAVDSRMGDGDWTNGQKLDKVLAAFPLAAYQITLFTLDSDIKTLSDLNGKTIGAGAMGGGPDLLFRKIVDKLGIECSIHNDGYAQTVQSLQDGVIDAVFTYQMSPWSSLVELEAQKSVYFPVFSDSDIDQIKEIAPFLADATISPDAYKGLTEEYKTIADWGLMAVGADVPEEDVYNIVKAVYDNYDTIKDIHTSCAYILPENAPHIAIPYHPGAARYYAEVGITVPTE